MGQSNAYLVTGTDYTFLVDAGYANKIHVLEEKLKENGLEFADIDLIILTHTHYDHVGCLANIKERSGAKILVHRDEADCLKKGHTPFPEGTMLFSSIISKIGNRFLSNIGKYSGVEPDICIDEKYELSEFGLPATVIPTPGHSSGSICVLVNDEDAIVGDTLFNAIPGTVYPPFANDEAELIKSWERLLSTGCQTFYPGHGNPFSREKFQKCFDRRRR